MHIRDLNKDLCLMTIEELEDLRNDIREIMLIVVQVGGIDQLDAYHKKIVNELELRVA